MRRICIGIHVHAEPEHLYATVASVRANTQCEFELLLLPDGVDEPARKTVAELSDIPQSATPEPRGAAACFNRMAAATDSEVVVLLESGSLAAPHWLDHLLAALEADPRNGLAGPSTNRSWNEQGVFLHRGGSPVEIARTAAEAERRFGTAVRTLEPLHSLADFCYAVRREVIETIGGADEGYGLGPCWEMDYNIRALRAGFRGVWACAAYVHRSPFTTRRRREEALRFEASKRRYQDKFCALRLRGEKTVYEAHCRGDACQHFAPATLIQLSLPLAGGSQPPALPDQPQPTTGSSPPHLEDPGPGQKEADLPTVQPTAQPLVTCIMPTFNRRAFVPQAIDCFLRQDYPHLELVIVDDGPDAVADCVPQDARIRYIRLDVRHTIGAKRNLACAQAHGEFIVHWDDDDWYPGWRVRVQLQALFDRAADMCGSSQVLYYDPLQDRAWLYHYSGPRAPWVAGNTLAYRKSFWAGNRFADIQVGEDTRFVWGSRTKVVDDLADPTLCVATLHAANTSARADGSLYWHEQPSARIHALLGDELPRYRLASAAELAPESPQSLPLVSCIMPTYNRRTFVPLALQGFLDQDYPNKELIIIDDGSDSVANLVENLPQVRYAHLPRRMSIGGKRNLACQKARGEIIAHWDDDDWYAPHRLHYQVGPILAGEADITGLENSFILELPDGTCWTTHSQLHRRMFFGDVHGGTLVYRKRLIEHGLRYPEANLAEDAVFLRQALSQGSRLTRLANPGLFIYMRHGHNAWQFQSGRFLDPSGWKSTTPPSTFPPEKLDAYRAAFACL